MCLFFNIHRYSFSIWHDLIDQSRPTEILKGHNRPIRGDDFLLDLPLILAQVAHRPAFPTLNENIGSGQHTVAPIKVPSFQFVTLFRPTTWGFFAGGDFGLSWMWWSNEAGLFYLFFLIFWVISHRNFFLSVTGAILFVFSPTLQFWSFHKGEIVLHWAIALLAIMTLLIHPKLWMRRLSVPILGWTLTGMAIDMIYPPIAVTLGWLLGAASLAFALERAPEIHFRKRKKEICLSVATALTLFILCMGIFWVQNHAVIELIQNTTYPGKRFSTGGNFPLWSLFAHHLLAQWRNAGHWVGNICEESQFFLMFPITLSLLILKKREDRAFRLDWAFCLVPLMAFFLWYSHFGLPSGLAKITLMGMSTSNRTQMAVGIADLLLLVWTLSQLQKKELQEHFRARGGLIGLWFALLLGFGFWLRANWKGMTPEWITSVSLASCIPVGLLLLKNRVRLFMGCFALLSVLYTFNFNPITRGGTEFLNQNPVARAIFALEKEAREKNPTDQPRWVVYGSVELSNYLRMIGVSSLGGYHEHPHFKLWSFFDPRGESYPLYNQCAYALFEPEAGTHSSLSPAQFSSPSPGAFQIQVSPEHPVFTQLGVHHFIAVGEKSLQIFNRSPLFEKRYAWLDRAIYKRKGIPLQKPESPSQLPKSK